jgi:hypothetical protein
VLHTVDELFFVRAFGRTGDETSAGGHVHKDDRMVFRVDILFHGVCGFRHVSNAPGPGDCPIPATCQAAIGWKSLIFPQIDT